MRSVEPVLAFGIESPTTTKYEVATPRRFLDGSGKFREVSRQVRSRDAETLDGDRGVDGVRESRAWKSRLCDGAEAGGTAD